MNVVNLVSHEKKATIETLKQLLEEAEAGNFDNFLFVCKTKHNEIGTAACNVDWGERNTLVGHLQMDIISKMIEANYITPE